MSLINQMLQDLDSRGTESVGTGAMYAQIRSVPQAPKRNPLRWLWLAVPLALVAAFAIWQSMPQSAKANKAIEPPMQAAAPVESAVQTSLMALKLSSGLSMGELQRQPFIAQESIDKIDTTALKPAEVATLRLAASRQSEQAGNKNDPIEQTSSEATQKAHTTAAVMPVSVSTQPKESVTAVTEKMANANPAVINKQVNALTVQQRAENEYRKALMLIQQGKSSDAIAGLELALKLDPQKAAARQALAGLLIDAKRPDEAAQRLQEGLTLDPSQAGLAMILARLQVEKGELRNAIETLQHTLPYAAERADYQAFLAALFQRDAKHKEAIEHYVAALRQSPQNGVWWMGLGISLQADNRLQEAQEAFGRAKASNVLSPELLAFVDQKLSQLKH